jgi:uncharacterized protein (TIGR00730 family)
MRIFPNKHSFKLISRHASTLKHVARQERHNARVVDKKETKKRIKRINKEFKQAFKMIMTHPDTVTIFGSARLKEDDFYFKKATELSYRVATEVGSTIVSGGGGGIMRAANKGAALANGESIGATIQLPHEQATNEFVNYSVDFYYFFSRKVALSFTARAYVYFPGGFGTLDEFFEIMTLKETGKIDPIPIILFGSDYWGPLMKQIEKTLLDKFKTISPKDLDLYVITDDIDEAVRIISRPIKRGKVHYKKHR